MVVITKGEKVHPEQDELILMITEDITKELLPALIIIIVLPDNTQDRQARQTHKEIHGLVVLTELGHPRQDKVTRREQTGMADLHQVATLLMEVILLQAAVILLVTVEDIIPVEGDMIHQETM